jgi:predicted permease
MLDILAITSPIFIIILLGFTLTRAGLFDKSGIRVIGTFVVNVALPALIFKAVSQKEIHEIFNLGYMFVYLIGSLLVLTIGYLWSRRLMGKDSTISTFYAMGMSCSNSMFIGYPILLLMVPSEAGAALAMCFIVENIVIIPLLLFMAEQQSDSENQGKIIKESFQRLMKNPIIIALLSGFLLSESGLSLPAPLLSVVDIIAASGAALSLFLIGGSLVGFPISGAAQRVLPITIGKLIVHPLMVFLLIILIQNFGIGDLRPSLAIAAIIMAAVPMFGIYPSLALKYGEGDFCSAALLFTTVISFLTLSILLFLLAPLIGQ